MLSEELNLLTESERSEYDKLISLGKERLQQKREQQKNEVKLRLENLAAENEKIISECGVKEDTLEEILINTIHELENHHLPDYKKIIQMLVPKALFDKYIGEMKAVIEKFEKDSCYRVEFPLITKLMDELERDYFPSRFMRMNPGKAKDKLHDLLLAHGDITTPNKCISWAEVVHAIYTHFEECSSTKDKK